MSEEANAPHLRRTVLVVDDNVGDVTLLEEAMRQSQEIVIIQAARSVDDAVAFLDQGLSRVPTALPCLIIIDLHMPGKGGKMLLERMHGHEGLAHVPTVVLTSSTWQQDIDECTRLGARHYRVKPFDWNGYLELVRFLRRFWTAASSPLASAP